MAAPTADDIYMELGAEGTPTDNTADIGGAPTGTDLTDTTANLLFDDTPAPAAAASDILHQNVVYWRCKEGNANDGFMFLANALRFATGNGVIQFAAAAGDAGKKIRVCGYSSSTFTTEIVTLIDGTVSTSNSYDLGTHVRAELLESDGITAAAAAAIITVTRGIELGILPVGAYMATTEYEVAIADTKNENFSASDRLSTPAGAASAVLGSYTRAVKTDNVDTSLTVLDLGDEDFIAWGIRKTLANGFLPPVKTYVQTLPAFTFSAAA